MSNKIFAVVGNRPAFMKIDKTLPNLKIIHTGAHYDYKMSQLFFKQLKLPKPYKNLNCKSNEAGKMFDKLKELFRKEKPKLVIVYGDTISTLMGALAARFCRIPLVHIEAGARSFTDMPEELNRVVADRIADVRICLTPNCYQNLYNEKLVYHTYLVKGDPMFDSMNSFLPIKRSDDYLKYVLLTIHRDFNVDNKYKLKSIFSALGETKENYIFPIHPRTQKNIKKFKIKIPANIKIIEPVGYKEMLSLESNAKKIITDSGGVQREAHWMRIPCIILRDETEWTEIVTDGWGVLVGSDKEKIVDAVNNFSSSGIRQVSLPEFGANKKIKEIISKYL